METDEALQTAASTTFGAAAAKASSLSTAFQTEMQTQTRLLIECELSKLHLKLAHFQEMEALLEKEVRVVEAERVRIYTERMAIKSGKALSGMQNVVGVRDVTMEGEGSLILLQQ
jgi:SWIRM-associated region 1